MLNQWFSDNISAYILLFYKRCPFTLRKGTFYNAKNVKSRAKRYAFANQWDKANRHIACNTRNRGISHWFSTDYTFSAKKQHLSKDNDVQTHISINSLTYDLWETAQYKHKSCLLGFGRDFCFILSGFSLDFSQA